MTDTIETTFDLTPPTQEQFQDLVADLSDEEKHVLLEHGTEAPFCGVFLDEKRPGVFTCRLCGLPLFLGGAKFESGTGWPSFTQPFSADHLKYYPRHQLRHGPHRDRLRPLRIAPGPRVRRRSAADRPALLHQFRVIELHTERRVVARQARPRRPGGRAGGLNSLGRVIDLDTNPHPFAD